MEQYTEEQIVELRNYYEQTADLNGWNDVPFDQLDQVHYKIIIGTPQFKSWKTWNEFFPSLNSASKMQFQDYRIELTERYFFQSGRYNMKYVEVTFWYNSFTMDRKETKREVVILNGETHKLPDWAHSCQYRPQLNIL